jgi:hypothetical protein
MRRNINLLLAHQQVGEGCAQAFDFLLRRQAEEAFEFAAEV